MLAVGSLIRHLGLCNRLAYGLISHKLNYGQGGFCQLDLCRKNYEIQFETIWEDHCMLEIDGGAAGQYLRIEEDGNKTTIDDLGLSSNEAEKFMIKFKIPEDYSFQGKINGSITQVKSQVSNKLRCYESHIDILGKNRVFKWGTWETPDLILNIPHGAVDIRSLTFQTASFDCQSFASNKVSFSQSFNLRAAYLAYIRSVVTYGNAVAKIAAQFVEIESISGAFNIEAEKVKIDRVWGSPNGIKIKAKKIQKLGIETGTGEVESTESISENSITLGKLHKGAIKRVSSNRILIQ